MFPGSTFGSTTSTPFGQSTFPKPATTGFSTPVFGSTGTSMFGAGTSQPSTGIFGSATQAPAFGQAQTQPAFGSGFSSTTTGTGLFGGQQNANTSGMFGSPSGSAFGQSKPTFGSFGSTQPTTGTSVFGTPSQQPQQTTVFGQPSGQSATGIFGGTAFGGASGGTTVKFSPLSGSDTMVKNGVTTTISTRHQCITCMKEYESKSLEELRLEDYVANRKGSQQGAQSSGGIFGASGQTSFFGSPSTGTTTGFGTGTSSVFGGANAFAKPTGTAAPTFGSPATTTTSFGFNSSTSVFGSSTNQVKPFATTSQGSAIFSSPSQPTTGFGTQSAFGPFGNQQQGTLFGQNKGGFNLPSTGSTPLNFGAASTTSTPGTFTFNQPKSATTGFASTTGFGAPATSGATFGTGGFGTTNQSSSLFGTFPSNNTGFGTFGQSSTATSTLGTGIGLGSGGSLFNTSGTKPGGIFGQNTTSPGLFGGNLSFGTGTSPFSTSGGLSRPNTSFGTLGTASTGLMQNSGTGALPTQTTNNTLNQHMLALACMPFGDSPLFKNILPATGKAEELIKPTSPAAQKALIAGQNFKVSSKSTNKIKVKPIGSHGLTKKSLFDGLESEEEQWDAAVSPIAHRPNPKRLNIKPRPFTENTLRHFSFLEQTCDSSRVSLPNLSSSPATITVTTSRYYNMASVSVPRTSTTSTKSVSTTEEQSTSSPNRSASFVDPFGIKELDSSKLNVRVGDETLEGEHPDETSSSTSGDSEQEATVNSIIEPETDEHPTGIILRRAGYYTIPSLNELTALIDSEGRCFVDNFTIGRLNYGNIFYPESFDVSGLNIDEIVHFRHKEVVVYPDDDKKPEIGRGLNRRAQVTLDRVWPIDKTTRLPISDPERIIELDYESKLRMTCAKYGTRFVEYRPQTGSWVFKVDHFSKYGLSDSDEEEPSAPVVDPKKSKVPVSKMFKVPVVPPALSETGLKGQLPQIGTASHLYLEEDDEEMEAEISTPFDLDDFQRGSPKLARKRLGSDLEASSRKVQLMKTSFFRSESVLTDDYYLNYDDYNTPLQRHGRRDMFIQEKTNSFAGQDYRLYYQQPQSLRNKPEPVSSEAHQQDGNLDEIEEEEMEIKPVDPEITPLKYLGEVIPMRRSQCGKLSGNCLVEMSIMFPSSMRPCWSKENEITIPITQKVSEKLLSTAPLDNLSRYFVGRSEADTSQSLLHRLKICGGEDSDTSIDFLNSTEAQLKVALEESVISIDQNGVPFIQPKSGDSALRMHYSAAENLAQSYKTSTSTLYHHVWGLCLALWGDLRVDSPDSHACVMMRRNQLSHWLGSVVSESMTSNKETSDSSFSSKVFDLMSGGEIAKAATAAQERGDHRLSFLLSQSGSGSTFRNLIKKQINEWKDTGADLHVDKERLKLLMLTAGVPVHSASNSKINTCLGLDWLRAFAVHLWYVCPPGSSVTDALISYEKSFLNEKYSALPLPRYVSDYSISGTDKPVYDICYHLLKLFSYKAHPLEQVLNPATYTPDPLDYRLSWFIMRFLESVGYIHLSRNSSYTIHTSFASQLESYGLWFWGIFALLHLPDSHERHSAVVNMLSQHIEIEEDPEIEKFLSAISIPEVWTNEAKANRALYEKKYYVAAKYFLLSENWTQAHTVIMEHIMPRAIIDEKYDYLQELMHTFEVNDSYKQVSGWPIGGALVIHYINVIKEVEAIVTSKDSSGIIVDLDKIQLDLMELCARIKVMRITSPLHRLSRAEMAKRCSVLVRSLSKLNENGTKDDIVKMASLISELPLTSDEAHQEWQAVLTLWSERVMLE